MSKNTYFTGQLIYSQILSLVKKEKINQISREGHYDHYVKKLDGYTHFVIMLYAVLCDFLFFPGHQYTNNAK